jgi:TolB-like protein/DNA-binding winged helix-turn-helix (wHTH) protein/Tfp pilus assembly protein PilF
MANETRSRAGRSGLFRFGPFELDLGEKELRKFGSRVKLQGQPFLVLCRLLQDPNHLVTREELRLELWPEDTFVDFEHGLNEAVNKLRVALGDSAASPKFVETVPRHGYRFIAEVERVGSERETEAEPENEDGNVRVNANVGESERELSPPGAGKSRRAAAWLGLGALSLAALTALLEFFVLRYRAASDDRPLSIRSLAVLPFENLSRDPEQEYFSDGMTDELTGQLAKIDALRVISRTSARRYKNADKSLREIGTELGVDALVEGSARLSEGKVRISVRLLEAASDRTLWTESYEGTTGDVLDIQYRVARAIAREVRAELSAREQARMTPRNVAPQAYEAFLKGRHHWNQRTEKDFLRAIEYFTEATSLSPRYAEAFAGLADTYTLLSIYNLKPPKGAMESAKAAALEALSIDPDLAEAHASYGCILFLYDWNWAESERELRKAIELNPGYANTYQCYGVFLAAMNRPDDALATMGHSIELDPMSLSINETLGWAYYVARRYPEAIAQFQKTLALDPDFGQALRYLGLTYLYLGRHEDALETLERARSALADEPDVKADLALAHALAGDKAEAEALLSELTEASRERYVSPFLIASFHVGLGNFEEALDWLDKAYEERVGNLVFIGVDPAFDPLRAHPRFQSLLARVGL